MLARDWGSPEMSEHWTSLEASSTNQDGKQIFFIFFLSDLFLKDFEIHIVGTFVFFFDTKSVAKLCLL